ncbi:BEN domain-containing protein 5-like [Apteryx mantelli]|uniref:BEN domain-containing protein 5-like n=1 Tax=Apteryx mantelli TaxID=2696672 RepID=A0ABM4EX91_9AVES
MYAFVRFLEDNVCYALPVSCVQDFSPKSQLDFDNQKVYTVYRNPEEAEEEDESPGEWGDRLLLHKAQILALAASSISAADKHTILILLYN